MPFHGRDVFAPAAAALAAGLDPRDAGAPVARFARLALPEPRREGEAWDATILAVDRFGNLIGNVPAESVGRGAWRARVGARRAPLVGTYGEAAPGDLVALVDSYGLVELAVRGGSAARELGLGPGDRFRLEPVA